MTVPASPSQTPRPDSAAQEGAERPPFYITTAIAYPNGAPHIGHAYEYISSDALARFKRLDGHEVFFMTGTDEHGLKMQQTAIKEGIDVRELAARNSDVFQNLDKVLNISYDRFIRTTDADHQVASKAIWEKMAASGDIYLDTYSGGTRFVTRLSTPKPRPHCWRTAHVSPPRPARPWSGPRSRTTPSDSRHTRTVSSRCTKSTRVHRPHDAPQRDRQLRQGRPQGPVDLTHHVRLGRRGSGDSDHVMYVWVDALTNYLTGVGYPNVDSAEFEKFWPASLHIIGKDITRFHTVYWPAFLMSAGIELPERVFVHGFLYNKGEKMSKSVGNVVDPIAMVDQYGLDAVRFFLLREISYGQDGSYSHEAIVTRMNADLSNELGNLAQRSLTMVAKNCDAQVPTPASSPRTTWRCWRRRTPCLPSAAASSTCRLCTSRWKPSGAFSARPTGTSPSRNRGFCARPIPHAWRRFCT
ncbi:hypothetical protein GCM10020255_099290 [Rhodococcus baikonurensis]